MDGIDKESCKALQLKNKEIIDGIDKESCDALTQKNKK